MAKIRIIGKIKRLNPKLLTLDNVRKSYLSSSTVAGEVSFPIKPEIYVRLLDLVSNFQQHERVLYLLVETDEKGYVTDFKFAAGYPFLVQVLQKNLPLKDIDSLADLGDEIHKRSAIGSTRAPRSR